MKNIFSSILIILICCDIVYSIQVFSTIKSCTYCMVYECCTDRYIKPDFNKLKTELNSKFYGQHIAKQVIIDSLKAHFKEEEPQKALTLSFHGVPGTGKNYATDFIIKAIYKEGQNSQYVHYFNSRVHFSQKTKVEKYKENLYEWIKGNVTNCDRSLFIFDEVHKMPPGVLEAINPVIDYRGKIDGVDFRKSVFIFLSNTGSSKINDQLYNMWSKGIKREDISLKDFENLITLGVFNEEGGFYMSETIKSNLIDHYIPFFPMEQKHVELCIQDQFTRRNIHEPKDECLKEALNFVEWGFNPEKLYATTGCKRVSQKVSMLVSKYYG